MISERLSGVLLHVTSLPSQGGIGDFGPAAYAFVDFLAAAKQRLWQVLPLNPVGYGNSPYSAVSAFAGNPLLISLEHLQRDGWLYAGESDGLAGTHAAASREPGRCPSVSGTRSQLAGRRRLPLCVPPS